MTAAQFDLLPIHDREQLVCLEGAFLAARQEPEFIIRLYQFDSFYVELYYHQVKDQAVWVRSFNALNRLDPYLGGIDVSGLI